MSKEFDVFGIGSPLIDIFMEAEDHHLIELELKKGQMHLVDHDKFNDMQSKFKKNPVKTSVAGDIVNTVMGVGAMGGRAVFCGKVGNDKYADIFEEVLASDQIKPVLARCDTYYTGQVISFVTGDGERTMTVHLGAAVGLKKEEAVFDDLANSSFLYTSGYVLDSPDLSKTVFHAFDAAKQHNVKVAFDMADPGVVTRHKDTITKIITENVNILFANETEAEEFTGKQPLEAAKELSKMCDIVVVKIGEEGSIIVTGDKIIQLGVKKEEAVDSTGAGDMYAAGFLYALNKTDDLRIAADVASFASAKVVKQFGAKLEEDIVDRVEDILEGKFSVLVD